MADRGMFKCLAPGAIGVKAPLEEVLVLIQNSGFSGLDINAREMKDRVDEQGANEVISLFESHNVRMGAWGLGMAWNGADAEYQEGLEALPAVAAAAASVGATRVSQWVPPASDDRRFRDNFRWHVERLRPVAEILRDAGCRLGLEFIGPRTTREEKAYGFVYTVEGMMALTEAIGTGNVGLLLDAWHWFTSLGVSSDLATLNAEDVVHVHVNDAPADRDFTTQMDHERALPSETGVIDLVGFLKALKEMGYDGPVTPEPFSARLREMESVDAIDETHAGLDAAWQKAGLE